MEHNIGKHNNKVNLQPQVRLSIYQKEIMIRMTKAGLSKRACSFFLQISWSKLKSFMKAGYDSWDGTYSDKHADAESEVSCREFYKEMLDARTEASAGPIMTWRRAATEPRITRTFEYKYDRVIKDGQPTEEFKKRLHTEKVVKYPASWEAAKAWLVSKPTALPESSIVTSVESESEYSFSDLTPETQAICLAEFEAIERSRKSSKDGDEGDSGVYVIDEDE